MNIGINMNPLQRNDTSLFHVSTDNRSPLAEGEEKKSFSIAKKAVNPIAERKAQAFEKARKIVSDAFEGEKKIDAEMQELRDLSAQLVEDNKEKLDQINGNKQEMSELQEYYGVQPDSQEQKDLELLMKKNDSLYDPSVRLTEEEQKRYEELMAEGKTEYQSRMMERYSENNRLNAEMQDNLAAIHANGSALRFIKGERLKSNPIGEAEDAAEKVLDAESDTIMGMLVGDAMEHVQEELQEKVEDAEKLAEKAEVQEEQIQETQEKVEQQTEKAELSDPEEIVEIQAQIQAEIDKVLEEMKLLAEDLKGNAIDKLL